MADLITPNMSLTVPTTGGTLGPTYANEINADLSLVDQHDHSSGKGVAVTPAGLAITSDLTFQDNNATTLRSVRLSIQGAPLALGSDLNCLYDVSGNLYFNDGSGNQIQITSAGGVNSGNGNITNLLPPAALTYVSATPAFVATSSPTIPANFDGGSLTLRPISAASNGITIHAPAGLPSNYSLTFPSALPASQKIATIDSSGNIAANYVVDNSTIEISSNTIRVKAGGITNTQLAVGAAAANLGAGTVTYSNIQSSNIGVSAVLSGTVTSTSFTQIGAGGVSHTGRGRPVEVGLISDANVSGIFSIETQATAGAGPFSASVRIFRSDGVAWDQYVGVFTPSQHSYSYIPLSSIKILDISVGVGVTFTYTMEVRTFDATHTSITVTNVLLYARELL